MGIDNINMGDDPLDFQSVQDCGPLCGEMHGTPINEMLGVPEGSGTQPITTARFDLTGLNNTGPTMS